MKIAEHIKITASLLIMFILIFKDGTQSSLYNYYHEQYSSGKRIDTSNFLDDGFFIPNRDSLNGLLLHLNTVWKAELRQLKKEMKLQTNYKERSRLTLKSLNKNLESIKEYYKNHIGAEASMCKQKACDVFVEIIKSKQMMYLYVNGELKDSFAVSTGIPSRETPNMDVRPSGPLFVEYTSTKFPGGDYLGLGNMPYAIFVKGGFAIHGTTPGNFKLLGTKASHGCIRLHPDNAKVLYELVNTVGLQNTWITVR